MCLALPARVVELLPGQRTIVDLEGCTLGAVPIDGFIDPARVSIVIGSDCTKAMTWRCCRSRRVGW
jgi:hypothetical protein